MARKILICDDDAGILDMISMILNFSGFEVISQKYSVHIFDDINKFQPELIILDLWMPTLSGDVIAQKLKSNLRTQHIPIIICSASRDGEKIAYESKADKYIQKPFDIDHLINSVTTLLSN